MPENAVPQKSHGSASRLVHPTGNAFPAGESVLENQESYDVALVPKNLNDVWS